MPVVERPDPLLLDCSTCYAVNERNRYARQTLLGMKCGLAWSLRQAPDSIALDTGCGLRTIVSVIRSEQVLARDLDRFRFGWRAVSNCAARGTFLLNHQPEPIPQIEHQPLTSVAAVRLKLEDPFIIEIKQRRQRDQCGGNRLCRGFCTGSGPHGPAEATDSGHRGLLLLSRDPLPEHGAVRQSRRALGSMDQASQVHAARSRNPEPPSVADLCQEPR